jgi:hypothetical protein
VNDHSLATPDFPKEQIVALAAAIIAVGAAAGLHISKDLQDRIITLVMVAYPVLAASLAHIRHGRSRALLIPPKGEVADAPAPRVARKAAVKR